MKRAISVILFMSLIIGFLSCYHDKDIIDTSGAEEETVLLFEMDFYDENGELLEDVELLTEEQAEAWLNGEEVTGIKAEPYQSEDDVQTRLSYWLWDTVVTAFRVAWATYETVKYIKSNKERPKVELTVGAMDTFLLNYYAPQMDDELDSAFTSSTGKPSNWNAWDDGIVPMVTGNVSVDIKNVYDAKTGKSAKVYVPEHLDPPVITPVQGTYTSPQVIELVSENDLPSNFQPQMVYTTDGKTPECPTARNKFKTVGKFYKGPFIYEGDGYTSGALLLRAATCFPKYYGEDVSSEVITLEGISIPIKVSGLDGGSVSINLDVSNEDTDSSSTLKNTFDANGDSTFSIRIFEGLSYTATIEKNPTGQTCTITNESGTTSQDMEAIQISCEAATYPIEVTAEGIDGFSVILQNNGGDDLTVSANGEHAFSSILNYGDNYLVTIKEKPAGKYCTISGGFGTIGENSCIGEGNWTPDFPPYISLLCSDTLGPNDYPWGSFYDNYDGTVRFEGVAGTFGGEVYEEKNLIWMKCTYGQEYDPSNNDCAVLPKDSPDTDYYGAQKLEWCSHWNVVDYVDTEPWCQGDVGTNHLGEGGFLNGATSEVYDACASLNVGEGTFGITTWRVPTYLELKLLISCSDKSMPNVTSSCGPPIPGEQSFNQDMFPQTVIGTFISEFFYYSSSKYGGDVRIVHFLNGYDTALSIYVGQPQVGLVRCVADAP